MRSLYGIRYNEICSINDYTYVFPHQCEQVLSVQACRGEISSAPGCQTKRAKKI